MAEANIVKLGEFDKDFEPEERLFHYTSSQGLYGILESGCLWATHFKYLNDSNEFFAARKSLKKFIEFEIRKKLAALKVSGALPLKEGVAIKDLSDHEADVIVDAMYTATLDGADPFVFSMYVSNKNSKNFRRGELLHWATYGRDGGYAIEINPHKVATLLKGKQQNIICQKALYVNDGVPKELEKEYVIIGTAAQEMIVGILQGKLEEVDVGKTGEPFMKIASRIKDSFFENEKEARLVEMRLKGAVGKYVPSDVFIRHQNSRPVPYIKLFQETLLGEMTPIEAIVIGPHPDQERRKDALSLFLQAKGLGEVSIVQSDVPYLGI